MRVRWLCVVLIAARGVGVADASELGAVPPLAGGGIERGIAFLRCATATKGIFQTSRGAILDVGATADVLLTTAHGLPPDAQTVKRDCRVLVRGKAHAIAEVWHAGGDRTGPSTIGPSSSRKRITGDVHRWRVGLATSELAGQAVVAGRSGRSRPALSRGVAERIVGSSPRQRIRACYSRTRA